MAYTKTAWVNGSAPAINATNLNKIEQGIADAHNAGGPVLLFDYTGADLVLDQNNPDINNNFFEFDLTGLEAPPTGYRMVGSFSHTVNMPISDPTLYIDINEGAISDPYNNGSWDSSGNSLFSGSVVIGADNSTHQTLIHTGTDITNLRALEFTQDFLVKDIGGADFCFGHGIWSEVDASDETWVTRITKSQILPTTFLDGTFKHIRFFNPIREGGANSYDIKTNPLYKASIKLYAI